MRHLSTIVLSALLLGFGQLALANGLSALPEQIEKVVRHTGPELPGQKTKPQQEKAATSTTVEVEKKAEQIKLSPKTTQIPAADKKEVKEISEPKPESSSLTFSFLYYLFYKFSVSDFFKTPAYNNLLFL